MRRWTVIDTNVLVSGVLATTPTSPPAKMVEAMLAGRVRFLVSQELVTEYRRVLLLPWVVKRHGMEEEKVDELLVDIIVNGAMRKPAAAAMEPLPVIRGDEHVIALLAAEPLALLITGDRALLDALRVSRDVMTPATFLAELEAAALRPPAAPPAGA